jgi:triacylglycerol lipase
MPSFPAIVSLLMSVTVSATVLSASTPASHAKSGDTVVLLHGLGRTPLSMKRLEWALRAEGYHVLNIGYPSRRHDIATLAEKTLVPLFNDPALSNRRIHIVTHSLGGILVRQYLHEHSTPANLGRIVMLAPPNHGSEIADRLRATWIYRRSNGPAGQQLGTGPASVPNQLGPIRNTEVGIIAGSVSLNPFFSAWMGKPGDGKVSLASARLEGMRDFLEVRSSHTWLMWRRNVLMQVKAFLREGRFSHPSKSSTPTR